jgi:hypothetical protein
MASSVGSSKSIKTIPGSAGVGGEAAQFPVEEKTIEVDNGVPMHCRERLQPNDNGKYKRSAQ